MMTLAEIRERWSTERPWPAERLRLALDHAYADVLELLAALDEVARDRDEWAAAGQALVDAFDPWKPQASPATVRAVVAGVKSANATLRGERDALRQHYDAAGPEHNLLALLDLYHDREMAAEAERDELRGKLRAMHRRAQRAEAVVTVRVEELEARGKSLGRALANVAADMSRARAERAEAERDALRADMEAAAGELPVAMPEPGTDAARLLSANVLLRGERNALRASVREATEIAARNAGDCAHLRRSALELAADRDELLALVQSLQRDHAPSVAAGELRGAEQERARIVAWLRGRQPGVLCGALAFQVELGDHLPDRTMRCATCGDVPHRWRPSPEAGPFWRCATCGEPNEPAPDPERCEVCDWPLADSVKGGCVPGNCSFRAPEGSPDWYRIKARREELAKKPAPAPDVRVAGVNPERPRRPASLALVIDTLSVDFEERFRCRTRWAHCHNLFVEAERLEDFAAIRSYARAIRILRREERGE